MDKERLEIGTVMYRYEDGDGAPVLKKFYVTHVTPRGYWISWDDRYYDDGKDGKYKWVHMLPGRKRHAYVDKDEAWESYVYRKFSQDDHLIYRRRQLDGILSHIKSKDPVLAEKAEKYYKNRRRMYEHIIANPELWL